MDAGGLRAVIVSAVALAMLSGGAGAEAATVTLGPNPLKTTGMMNAPNGAPPGCGSGSSVCVYFNTSAGGPSYIAPFDGVITTWRVSSGSASGTLTLRVLRPAGANTYTLAGSSSAQPNAGGVQTFSAAVPVRDGDTIALENESNAILLGPGATGSQTNWFSTPSTPPDGATLSADGSNPPNCGSPPGPCEVQLNVDLVESSPGAGTGSLGTGSVVGPGLGSPPAPLRGLTLGDLRVTPSRFGRGSSLPRLAAVGARITFTLGRPASVRLSFDRARVGHRVGRACRPGGTRKARKRCTIYRAAGGMTVAGHRGPNTVLFAGRLPSGRQLALGNYRLTAQAADERGRSAVAGTSFTLVRAGKARR